MKQIRQNYKWIIVLVVFSTCHKQVEVLFRDSLITSNKRIEIKKLQFDTIRLDRIESSYLGSIKIVGDSIYFIDKRFCWVFTFDKNGKYLNRYLGRGEGPYELNTSKISAFEKLNNGDLLFVNPSNKCFVYDDVFKIKKVYRMSKVYNKIKYMHSDNIDPSMDWIYTLSYNKLIIRNYKGYAYFNIYCEHPLFNSIITPQRYFKHCRLLAKMDLKDGAIEKMYGRFSPVYQDNEYLKYLIFISYDITNSGNFYICFEADSLIYEYDSKYNLIGAFGFKGRDMDQDYAKINSIQQFKSVGRNDREEKGYYDWVEYIDEKEMLFRSYKKGSQFNSDGLQIYNNKVLIADVDVPKNLRVIGYIKPYIYSEAIIDEEREIITIYRFKI